MRKKCSQWVQTQNLSVGLIVKGRRSFKVLFDIVLFNLHFSIIKSNSLNELFKIAKKKQNVAKCQSLCAMSLVRVQTNVYSNADDTLSRNRRQRRLRKSAPISSRLSEPILAPRRSLDCVSST